MATQLDLSRLALERPTIPSQHSRNHGKWLTRYVVPGVLLIGFIALFAWATRDRLVGAKEVTIVPVVTKRSSASAEGTPLFKAAGWVEPRPTATYVTALSDGFVKELLVIEGQIVTAGDVLARLVDDDARLLV